MIQEIYLTIDDAPSIHLSKKIDFLKSKNIPALFFVRGEFINKNMAQLVHAILAGFEIGNHSYFHPYYSETANEAFFDEILKTEELIQLAYQKANRPRAHKFIRLPFGDRGAGRNGILPNNLAEIEKSFALQSFLINHSFEKISFEKTALAADEHIDAFWTWDSLDYKSKLIANNDDYGTQFEATILNNTDSCQVLLLHDFESNHHLFETSMEILERHKIKFLPFKRSP